MRDESDSYNSGSFGCVVERNLSQGVICFLRNGEAFFGFRSAGSEHRTVVHADGYIELLQELRQHPIPEPVEIMRFRGEGR